MHIISWLGKKNNTLQKDFIEHGWQDDKFYLI